MKARVEVCDLPEWTGVIRVDALTSDPAAAILERLYALGRGSRKICLQFSREQSPLTQEMKSVTLSVTFDLADPRDQASHGLEAARQRLRDAMLMTGPNAGRVLQDATDQLKAAQEIDTRGLENVKLTTSPPETYCPRCDCATCVASEVT